MSKGERVQRMFDAIAGRYDLMNRVMTLGQDQSWRRFVVKKAGNPESGWSLDLATGTGDIAALTSLEYPGVKVVAGDFSCNMLAHARQRFPEHAIHWQACDALALPYADGTFKSVTFGYLLRNVEEVDKVLAEVYRVLQAGGRIVCLDTTPPSDSFLLPFVNFYLKYIIPVLGKILARDESAYAYLTGSTMDFYESETLKNFFEQAGFSAVGYKKFMFGTIAVHWGEKPAE